MIVRLVRTPAIVAVAFISLVLGTSPRASGAGVPHKLVQLQTKAVALSLNSAGIYQIDGRWLLAHGVSWTGLQARDLAITFEGKPVSRFVSTSGKLTDASYAQFYAPALSTMYTSTAVYILSSAPSLARAVQTVDGSGASHGRATTYSATDAVGPKRNCATQRGGCIYEPMAPGGKWFYNEIIANGGPSHLVTNVRLDHVVITGQAALSLDVWGVTDFTGPFPQHEVVAFVNMHRVLDMKFSGSLEQVAAASFPERWLLSGKNSVRIELPGTVKNQYSLDITDIRGFSLTYNRQLVAQDDSLAAVIPAATRAAFTGFTEAKTRVWQLGNASDSTVPRIVTKAHTSGSGGDHSVSFVAPSAGEYLAVDASAVLTPTTARPLRPTSYLLEGKADLLIISPRGFWPALAPLVAYHDSHGVTVKLAAIDDVFDRFTHGVFDPSAIRDYVEKAIPALGTTAVLLVGVDTYDYHHFLDCADDFCRFNPGDISLVPSLYTMDSYYGQIPSDELLVDNGGVPQIAVGRIPAVTSAQLSTVVSRTLSILRNPPHEKSAVMVAGTGDPGFAATSDALASKLPATYSVTKLDEPAASHKATRDGLIGAVRKGVTIADFVGHGNLEQWDQNPVLSVGDVAQLRPKPPGQLYFGWGCQTAYDVDPTDRALNARLLFKGGAALTLGSTGLDLATPQAELAQAFYHELFHDPNVTTVGQALEAAENVVEVQDPSAEDPIRSYEIFGDPMAPVALFR